MDGTQGRIGAIDGLRAVAIAGVVLYHLRPSPLPGGFLGVTVFLVITGYLATRSVERRIARGGAFSYGRYLAGRLARLLPPVLAAIALTALGTYLASPGLLPKVQADALPSALFLVNWSYIFRQVSYFAAAGLPSPLTHLWYLAVAMQFYFVWPAVVMAAHRVLRTRGAAIAACAVLAALSTALMALLLDPAGDTARVYYGTDTRLAELSVGALTALALDGLRARGRRAVREGAPLPLALRVLPAAGALGLAALLAGFAFADGESPLMYRGGYLLAAAAAGFALAGAQVPGGLLGRLLSLPPLTWLGSRSFSLYLVHYPLLIFMNPAVRTTSPAWWEQAAQVLVALVAAEVFYRLVEAPCARLARRPSAQAPAGAGMPTRTGRAGGGVPAAGRRGGEAPAEARRSNGMRRAPGPSGAPAGGRDGRRSDGAGRTGRRAGTGPLGIPLALAGAGAVAVACLAFAPVDWQAVSQRRAVELRPELAQGGDEAGGGGSPAVPEADAGADPAGAAGDADASVPGAAGEQEAHEGPVAEKVPDNLPWRDWSFDESTGTCDARVLIIGDSVTEGASGTLRAMLPEATVDGQVSRQLYTGPEVYAGHEADGTDGDAVVVALGGNSLIRDESQVQDVIDMVGGKPLYFVTIRSPYPLQDINNEILRRYASQNANVGIIDWCGASEGHSEYLVDDGVHLTDAGCQAFAQLIRQALCGS